MSSDLPLHAEPMSTAGTVTPDKMIANMLEMRKEYHQKAQSNIKRAQERKKEYFDAKHDSNHVSDELKNYIYIQIALDIMKALKCKPSAQFD